MHSRVVRGPEGPKYTGVLPPAPFLGLHILAPGVNPLANLQVDGAKLLQGVATRKVNLADEKGPPGPLRGPSRPLAAAHSGLCRSHTQTAKPGGGVNPVPVKSQGTAAAARLFEPRVWCEGSRMATPSWPKEREGRGNSNVHARCNTQDLALRG